MADENNKNTNGTVIETEFVDYSQFTPGNVDPTKDLQNLESGETLSESLGKTKRWIEVLQEGGGSGGSEPEEVVSEAFPCASGFENFSTNSIVFKKGTVVTFAIILTIKSGTTCNAHTLIGTISSQFRPPSTNVLPGILAYESNADPAACGVNVNSDGTVRYYGITAGAGRHICIKWILFSIIIIIVIKGDQILRKVKPNIVLKHIH